MIYNHSMPYTEAQRKAKREYYYRNRQRENARMKQWREDNGERARATARVYRRARPEVGRLANMRHRHGPLIHIWWAKTWEQQSGACCYCHESFTSTDVIVIDHDHRCCPSQSSCSNCRRGLAHTDCNIVIGIAREDPNLLHQIANSLEEMLSSHPIMPIAMTPLF